MRRGLLLSVSLGLLTALVGCCHRCHGVCDCPVQPIDHITPSPLVKPALSPGEPPHAAPVPNAPVAP